MNVAKDYRLSMKDKLIKFLNKKTQGNYNVKDTRIQGYKDTKIQGSTLFYFYFLFKKNNKQKT